MRGFIPPFPQYASMEWCSVKKKHRDNITFILPPPHTDDIPAAIQGTF
jgi:hypothetical protein